MTQNNSLAIINIPVGRKCDFKHEKTFYEKRGNDMKINKHRQWRVLCLLLLIFAFGVPVAAKAVQPLTVQAAVKNGWVKSNGIWYYYRNGKKITNQWIKDNGKWYHLQAKTGAMSANTFVTWKGKKYYVNASGAKVIGWLEISSGKYRFSRTGILYRPGWHTIEGRRYYINKNGTVKTGWFSDGGKKYYLAMSGKNKGAAAVGTYVMSGYRRTFDSNGVLIKTEKVSTGTKNQLQKSTGTKTIRNYLLEAMRPVGTTDYLLGGGWHQPEITSKTVPAKLDCSGFVGWTTYQIMHKAAGEGNGYTVKSYSTVDTYVGWGWGTKLTSKDLQKNNYKGSFKAGDIVNRRFGDQGHVWIVIGGCSDGSYVLVHTSPPCTQIAGTPSYDNRGDSEAIELAKKYMTKYYKNKLDEYNIPVANTWATDQFSYMSDTALNSFRWSSSVLSDPDGFKNKSAAQILKSLFGE